MEVPIPELRLALVVSLDSHGSLEGLLPSLGLWREEEEECGDTEQQESGKPKCASGQTISRKCCTLQVRVTSQHLSFQMV